MKSMFYDCKSLISIDLSKFNTQNVKSMFQMFFSCSSLIQLIYKNLILKMLYQCFKCFVVVDL